MFEHLALYNQWINNSLYEAVSTLTKDELKCERAAFFGSDFGPIIGTLNHIMVGDIFWFKRFAEYPEKFEGLDYFRTLDKPNALNAILYAELADLKKARIEMDEHILNFTRQLTHHALNSVLNYQNASGIEHSKNVSHLLQHVFNHQTHHRGQVSTLLFQAGIDMGVTDMLAGIEDE